MRKTAFITGKENKKRNTKRKRRGQSLGSIIEYMILRIFHIIILARVEKIYEILVSTRKI